MSDDSVGVIGAGSWGTTLAKVLADNEKRVLLWTRRENVCDEINTTHQNSTYLADVDLPANLQATSSLEDVADSCELILFVVPSHGFRAVVRDLGNFVSGRHIVVHATKGIEQETHKRMSELIREETCLRKIGVLSGPNLARELSQRHPTGTLIASPYAEVFQRCHAALHNDYFRVYGGADVVGAEVGGAFKNIVALAAGVAAGLELGENTKALLLTRGLNEMARFGSAMGANVLTFGGMAGIGDMIATCASPLSRNHQVGRRLARGDKLETIISEMNMVAEGVKTAKAVHTFAEEKGLDLPIVAAVHRLLHEGGNVPTLLKDLMNVPTGEEFAALNLA